MAVIREPQPNNEHSVLKRYLHQTLTPKARGSMWGKDQRIIRARGVTDSEETKSWDTTGLIWPHWDWQHIWNIYVFKAHMRHICVQSRHIPSTEKRRWRPNPTLTKKLFANDASRQGGKSVLPNGVCHWVAQSHAKGDPIPRSSQPKTDYVFFYCYIYLLYITYYILYFIFFLFWCFIYYCFCFILIFIIWLFGNLKLCCGNMKSGGEGSRVDLGKVEEGKEHDQNTLYKK